MSYECKILADSVSTDGAHRLTTFCITFPRLILAEVNTHRMLSRNSASSRAIPVEKSIEAIEKAMFVPDAFGANQKGMQADEDLGDQQARHAEAAWRYAGREAIQAAYVLKDLGVHKAWANRPLEPYKWHTAIVTATEWDNFFALRTHKDAQPEFRQIATMMRDAYRSNEPWYCPPGCWHLPLVSFEELGDEPDYDYWSMVSVGRCARVSVETHFGVRDTAADVGLHNRLLSNRHLSPFEHVARPFHPSEWGLVRLLQEEALRSARYPGDPHAEYLHRIVEFKGNLRGWHSARMDVPHEHDFQEVLDAVHS